MFNNNKAMSNFFITVALALITFILLVVFYNNIWGAGKINVDNKLTCQGAFGVGYGECINKEDCNAPSQSIASKDCKDEGMTCCISLEKPDSILAPEFGGNDDFNFIVTHVGPGTVPAGCTKQNNKDYELVCTPDRPITLAIKVGVENTGAKVVDVFANPTIVDLSGGLSPKILEGSQIKINSKQKQELYVNYIFTGAGTSTGRQYRVYPAAKCISSDCKKTNVKGIYKKLEGSYINIAFVK
jgi:hypothetical protein